MAIDLRHKAVAPPPVRPVNGAVEMIDALAPIRCFYGGVSCVAGALPAIRWDDAWTKHEGGALPWGFWMAPSTKSTPTSSAPI